MYHMIEKFVDSPSVITCEWDNDNPRCFEEYLLSDMEKQVLNCSNGQRPIWVMESTNTETGEIGASFHRDNPSAAFGWSEHLMELIHKFAAKNAANNTTENNEEDETMDTINTTTTTETTATEPETVTTEPERRLVGHCYECGEPIYEDDDYDELPDGHLVCTNCVDQYRCSACGSLESRTWNLTTIYPASWHDERRVCEECRDRMESDGEISQCECCGEWYEGDGTVSDTNGMVLCESCYDNHYVTCADCGSFIRTYDAHYSDDDGENYCDDCWEDHKEPKHLYGYHEYGAFHFIGNDRDKFGLELETDTEDRSNQRDYVEDLWDHFEDKFFYMAQDGSLNLGGSHSGVEIITMPCDFDYHMNEFPWEQITEIAKRHDYRSHDAGTCGLHVHVSRTAFGDTYEEQDLTAAKICVLMDRHWAKISKFSRRRNFEYCAKLNADIKEYDSEDDAVEKAKSRAVGHYRALNLCNSNTVEFRVFRGTLNVNTIKATIQFVKNMVEYAKVTPLRDILGADFADYALYHRYPELDAYLRQRSLMPAQMDEPDESVEE